MDNRESWERRSHFQHPLVEHINGLVCQGRRIEHALDARVAIVKASGPVLTKQMSLFGFLRVGGTRDRTHVAVGIGI